MVKLKDLEHKPFELGCCKNDCDNYNKDFTKCLKPLCIDLAIHNGLIETKVKKKAIKNGIKV